jgi:hypothetical protein
MECRKTCRGDVMKKIEDIKLVKNLYEATERGWMFLGSIIQDGSLRGLADVWCKKDIFVILGRLGDGNCYFISYISRVEAVKRLTDTENKTRYLETVTYSTECKIAGQIQGMCKRK